MDSSRDSNGTVWPAYFVGAAAVVVILAAVHVAADSALVHEAAWTLLVVSVLTMVLAGIRRHRPERDRPWKLLAFAMGLLVVDNLVLFPVWGPSPARDVISDLAQLLAFPCLGLVALGLVHRQLPNGDREGAIDACTVMVALFSALYALVFAPQTADSPTVLGTAVWLVAPLLLAAVTAAGLRLVFVGGHHVVSMWFIVASSVAALVGHVLRTLAQSAGTYERGEWQDLFVAAAYVAAGLAALHPSMTLLTQPAAPATSTERRLAVGRLSILGISLATPSVTMLLQGDGTPRFVPLVASIAATVLVMWRLWRLIDERERVRDEMARAAIQDSLTGLPNRVAMLDGLAAALARGSRADTETALLFIDLDDFKTVNDTWGHAAGDHVLMVTAARLGNSGRTGDLLARLAGDEFVMVCEDTQPEVAVAIARRTIDVLQAPLQVEGVAYALTASVGVATSRTASDQSDLLVSAADHAMYQAKRQGGSAVWLHGASRDSDGTTSQVVRTG